MLNIGKVYSFQNCFYYVADKKRKNKRIIYLLKKVNSDGTLGTRLTTYFKSGCFEQVNNVKVIISVQMSRPTRDLLAYNFLVSRTKEIFENGRDSSRKIILTKEMIYKIAESAIASITFYNRESGAHYTIKEFATAIGLKNGKKLYEWIVRYMNVHFSATKYKKAIPEASDITIISVIKNYQKNWDSIHGFNKKINALIEKDFKAYMDEFKNRGLSL